MTLIARITSLKDTIDTQNKNYDAQFIELEDRREENQKLVDHNEELIK